jgi:palmitoyltransferase ZDHHC9/14/18
MSSQALQAQRGSRPPTMSQQYGVMEDLAAETMADNAQQRQTAGSPLGRLTRQVTDEGDMQPPPSRGTAVTSHDTYEDITTNNTSPTQGHGPSGSLSESVRPLQRKKLEGGGLSVNIDKSRAYGVSSGNIPSPARTPRSFRSSFLHPKGEGSGDGSNRSMPGAEKLASNASSPQFTPTASSSRDNKAKIAKAKASSAGRNYEYFEGNTVFCIGGRLQNTRHRPINIATGTLTVIPCVFFFVFSASYLWHHVSPAVPLLFAYVSFICVSSFLHGSGSDPGVSDGKARVSDQKPY